MDKKFFDELDAILNLVEEKQEEPIDNTSVNQYAKLISSAIKKNPNSQVAEKISESYVSALSRKNKKEDDVENKIEDNVLSEYLSALTYKNKNKNIEPIEISEDSTIGNYMSAISGKIDISKMLEEEIAFDKKIKEANIIPEVKIEEPEKKQEEENENFNDLIEKVLALKTEDEIEKEKEELEKRKETLTGSVDDVLVVSEEENKKKTEEQKLKEEKDKEQVEKLSKLISKTEKVKEAKTGTNSETNRKIRSIEKQIKQLIKQIGVVKSHMGGGLDPNKISSNLIPTRDDTYSLGSIDKRWENVYVGSGSLFIGDKRLSVSESGNLLFGDADDLNPTAFATEEYVNTSILDLIDSAPETLNTLNELAEAIQNINTGSTSLLQLQDVDTSNLTNNAILQYKANTETIAFTTEINQSEISIDAGQY